MENDNMQMQHSPLHGSRKLPPPSICLKPWRPQQAVQAVKMLQQPSMAPLKYLKIDSLQAQLQTSVEARLPAWASETATETVEQSMAQATNPFVLANSAEFLGKLLADAAQGAAAVCADVVGRAGQEAAEQLADDSTRVFANQVVMQVAYSNRAKAASVLDAEVASPRPNQVIQASMEKAVRDMLVESQVEAVATLSHYALQQKVEALLSSEVFPWMQQTVTQAYSKYLQQLVRSAGVAPAVPLQSIATARAAAAEAAAESMQLSLQQSAPPVRVPVAAVAAPMTPPHFAEQGKKTPLRAPVPRYACGRSAPARPAPSPLQLDAVPDEVLLDVLAYVDPLALLKECSLVSRRWLRLCRSDALWRHKEIRYDPGLRPAFAAVLRLVPVLAMVDCEAMASSSSSSSTPSLISDHDLLRLLQAPCRIKGLRLPTAVANAPPSLVVSVLDKHRATLEELQLTSKHGHGDDGLSDDLGALLRIADHMPALRRLSLVGAFHAEVTLGPRQLGAPPRRIEELDLSRYWSSSAHTASSLLAAYSGSLHSVSLPLNAGAAELSRLAHCSRVWRLTAPADVLAQWSVLPHIVELTLTAPYVRPFSAPVRLPVRPLANLSLSALVLDGVPSAADVPHGVRVAAASVHTLTLRRTAMEPLAVLLLELPSLVNVVLDQVEDLSAQHFRMLAKAEPGLRRISVLRSLRCSDDVCWEPVTQYVRETWPLASVRVDVCCSCSSSSE